VSCCCSLGNVNRSAREPRFFLGWIVVAVAGLVAFTEVAFFNPVLGVFIPEFEREFGWSRTEISLGVTVGSLVGAAISPFLGPLIDRYGGRMFVAGGTALTAVALVLLANMQTEWQFFLIYGLGRGTASGLITLAATVTVSKWFVRRRGFAVGVTTLGSRAGFALLPISVQLLIDAQGWRTAVYALALTVGTIGVLPVLKWFHAKPEDFGLEPDGDAAMPVVGSAQYHVAQREISWSRADALRTRSFWLITGSLSLLNFATGAVNLHQIPHLVDSGLQPAQAALIISLLAVFSAAGALVEGVIDAKFGARRTLMLAMLVSAGGMVVLMNTTTVWMGVAYAGVYGLAFGLMITSNQIVFAEYYGREALGAIRGAAAPFQMALNSVGPIVAGLAFDLTGSYLAAFVPFTGCYLIAAAALAVAHRPPLPAHVRVQTAPEAAG